MSSHLVFASLLVLIALYWFKAQRVKELALQATQAYCINAEVQLLDGYVALNRLWLARDRSGKLKLKRTYLFEFSSTGNDRYNGICTMLGQQVESIRMEPYRIN